VLFQGLSGCLVDMIAWNRIHMKMRLQTIVGSAWDRLNTLPRDPLDTPHPTFRPLSVRYSTLQFSTVLLSDRPASLQPATRLYDYSYLLVPRRNGRGWPFDIRLRHPKSLTHKAVSFAPRSTPTPPHSARCQHHLCLPRLSPP